MHNGDRAVLRISSGTAVAALVCYGLALPMPHLGVIMAWIVLCQGKPLPIKKGIVVGVVLMATMIGGVLMVPLLTHYPMPALLFTALLLYLLMLMGLAGKSTQAMLLTTALTVIPIAGLIEQSLAIGIAQMMGLGIIIGTVVNRFALALFPPHPTPAAAAKVVQPPESPHQLALRAVLIVMPVWLLALSNPAFYIPAVMKTVMLAQQTNTLSAKQVGRELVFSTLMGAVLAVVLWFGLSIWPSLLMLVLWLALVSLWVARRMVRLVANRFTPSFWSNAWITCLILFGPAIQDSASGKDVWLASAMRCSLYVAVALYGWACVVILERWHPSGRPAVEATPGD
ncbi:putative membrane protein [Buttiauxella ferragutiae ATCC 51602]|uniref:Membrane protein n=1 Tax=Buttiauxella ferragutiae ATCC 51602 TaxID=1354252 RepID=A0ABX2W262_9ENTR|nr:DUF2955 domain-containing protein [Buttiauxella ferragutiae]OAT24597.1 putative membrane protein [Buttiauxella ferragutiae ATCC 51602]